MSDLDSLMIKKRAFNHRIPMSESARYSGSGISGAGLRRSGGFAVPPVVATAMMPAVQGLINEGVKELPKLVWKGVKKVGSFFKKLFGGEMDGMDGGMRIHSMSDPTGSYHDLPLYRGNFQPEDRMLPFYKQAQIERYNNRYSKIKGGFAPINTGELRSLIASDTKFASKLGALHKKPHRFLNLINKKMKKVAKKKA